MVGGSCGDGGGSGGDRGGGNGRHHLSPIVVHHHPQHPLLPGETLLIFLILIFVSHVDHGRLGQTVTAHCKLLMLLLVWNWWSRRRIAQKWLRLAQSLRVFVLGDVRLLFKVFRKRGEGGGGRWTKRKSFSSEIGRKRGREIGNRTPENNKQTKAEETRQEQTHTHARTNTAADTAKKKGWCGWLVSGFQGYREKVERERDSRQKRRKHDKRRKRSHLEGHWQTGQDKKMRVYRPWVSVVCMHWREKEWE